MKCRKLFALLLSLCMIASSFVAVSVAAETTNVINIDLPLDDASELTWVQPGVTVSNADGIGGRDSVVKVAGLSNSNNNTAGVKLPDGFAFKEGDVLTYSIDVYSEAAINPDVWLRNHSSGLNPFATFFEQTMATNEWVTVTKTFTYDEMEEKIAVSNSSGSFGTAGNYALYIRTRQNATAYLDNFKVTVSRVVEGQGGAGGGSSSGGGSGAGGSASSYVVDIDADSASEFTWVGTDVTVTDVDGIGGRDDIVKASNVSNTNTGVVGVKIGDSFAFQEGDILTYSVDVYSESAIKPDIYVRDHSDYNPMAVFYNSAITAGEWNTIEKTVTYAELTTAIVENSSGSFDQTGTYAIYVRPREGSEMYLDNFKVTVEREESEDSGDITGGFTVEPTVSYATEENGVYKFTTADVATNDASGAWSSLVRLRIIPETPISKDADIKISLDFEADGILNSIGQPYATMEVNLRLYDSLDGSNQAATIGYIKNASVAANTGSPVTVDYKLEDMVIGGGTSTAAEIKSIGIQVNMHGACTQYGNLANDGYFTISNIQIGDATEEGPNNPIESIDYSKYETTILTGTDFQAESNSVGAQNVTNIIDAVKESGLSSADAFLFCGDYENTSGLATTEGINALKGAVSDFVPDEESHIYVQGNHDAALGTPGLSASGNNDPANGDYGVFVINEDDYGCTNDLGKVMRTADNLASYLNEKLEAEYDKPIFVLSHVPLYYSTRTLNDANAKFANYIFHVLNQAGEQGLEIIFLAGHDHSRAYESYLGGSSVYLAKGDKINIAQSSVVNFVEETLNFTYMNAGYVGYYNVGNGADNALTMLVIGIDEDTDTVDVYRFDKDGLHNLKSAGKLLDGESDLYTANTTVYASPQTVASSTVNYENEITTLPSLDQEGEKVVDIDSPFDTVSDVTWVASDAVTVTEADGIGGRDNVIKATGLANSNNNTVGVKLADNFAFQEGDVISFSFDVYSETAINPDVWIRNHGSTSLQPFDQVYNSPIATNTWTTVASTIEFAELNEEYDWTTVGNYAIYLRPRQNATAYLDNFKVTVTRVGSGETETPEEGNIIKIEVNGANDISWTGSENVTVSDANEIGGRDNVIKAEGLADSNNNTVGVKLGDEFAFQAGDVLKYSVDVYSATAINPDIWLRNHTNLPTFKTFYKTPITANTWTTVEGTVTYEELVASGVTGWSDSGMYALYLRPRTNATVYLDNFTVTVTGNERPEGGEGGDTGDGGDTGETPSADVTVTGFHNQGSPTGVNGPLDYTLTDGTFSVNFSEIKAFQNEGGVNLENNSFIRVTPATPIHKDAKFKLTFDLETSGIANDGGEVAKLNGFVRVFDKANGTTNGNTLGYLRGEFAVNAKDENGAVKSVKITLSSVNGLVDNPGTASGDYIKSMGVGMYLKSVYEASANEAYFKISNVNIEYISEIESCELTATTTDSATFNVSLKSAVIESSVKSACAINGAAWNPDLITVVVDENDNKKASVTIAGLASSTEYELTLSDTITPTTTKTFTTLDAATVVPTYDPATDTVSYSITNNATGAVKIYAVLLRCKGNTVIESKVISPDSDGCAGGETISGTANAGTIGDGEYVKFFAWTADDGKVNSLAPSQIFE